MTTGQLIGLVLGSAAIGAAVAALISGIFNYWIKLAEIKEGRIRIALELTRLKSEETREVSRQAGGSTALWDPAVALSEYLEALDEIARRGRWAKGDRNVAAYRAGKTQE